MADPTYQPKVYRKRGGDEIVVASGGKITIEPGGAIDGYGPSPSPIYVVDALLGDDDTASSGHTYWEAAQLPYKTLQAAINASETARLAATSIYARPTIIIRSNGGYSGGAVGAYIMTATPQYTDVIGEGASPFGSGSGIVIIAGTAATVGTMRGNYFENICFEAPGAGTTYYGLFVTHLLRTRFYHCSFMGANTGAAAAEAGLYIAGDVGGVEIERCMLSSNLHTLLYGIKNLSGSFNDCLVKDNTIVAATVGVYINSPGRDGGTRIEANTISSGGWRADTPLETGVYVLGGENCAKVVGNYIIADDCINHTFPAECCVANHCIQGGVGAIEYVGT